MFSNIDKLLKMPWGCGEQNMINFAPAVFIYRYLLQTSQLTPEIEAKARVNFNLNIKNAEFKSIESNRSL